MIAPVFYVGLDDQVVDDSLPNVSTLGLRKDMGIPSAPSGCRRWRTGRCRWN